MTNKRAIKEDDLIEMYDMLQKQLVEDRDSIVALYNDLKQKTITKEDFSINGQNLAKYAELMSKCTSQLIEIIKINKKSSSKDESLSEDDISGVYKNIEQ